MEAARRNIDLGDFGLEADFKTDQPKVNGPLGSDANKLQTEFKGYFASALTGITAEEEQDVDRVQEVASEICRKMGIDLYCPKNFTSPTHHADVEPSVVYTKDRRQVATSDVIILYANKPSYGAGQELEISRHALTPVLIVQPRGVKLSRMVLGSPSYMATIDFSDLGELRKDLARELGLISPYFDEARRARAVTARQAIGVRIQEERALQGISRADLADRIGITEEELEAIETERPEIANPSIIVISRICQRLGLEPALLFNPALPAKYERLLAELRPLEQLVVGARDARALTAKDRAAIHRRFMASLHRAAISE